MSDGRYEFNNTPAPKKKVNKEKKYGLIVILLLLILLLGAITFVTTQTFLGGSPTQFVDVPVIQTYVASADGGVHMFGTQVVLELDNNAPDVDPNMLHSVILAAVSSLSYEDVTNFYGMEILRDAVHARLSASFDEEQLLGVYFAQFLSDMPLPNLEEERVPGRNPLIEAITGN